MIHITDAAQHHFSKLLAKQERGDHIRVFVIHPGTPRAECGVSYCPLETVSPTDTELQFEKFSAFIDELSAPYLVNAEIDLVTDELGIQLTLKAPNAKIRKIKDSASLIERVEYLLQLQINPKLANHGGHVTVIEITDDNLVILQFSGSCNGCVMANFTLKEEIEKKLLQAFPQLQGVRDLTQHQHNKHSYY